MAKDLLANRDEMVALLSRRNAGLFFDIDGTLSPLQSHPADAVISSRLRTAVHTLSRTTHVVLLSGRSVPDSRKIVGLDGVTYSGNHGVEWHRDGDEWVIPEAEPYVSTIHGIAEDAAVELRDVVGLYIEDKGPSLSIHYRQADDRAAAASAIHAFIRRNPAAQGLKRAEGKLVIELRPPIDVNKGTSVETVVAERQLEVAVVFGDDVTDVDAFLAVQRLRDEGRVGGAAVGVFSPGTPDVVRAAADYTLADTDAVEEFVVWLSERLG